MSKIGIICIVLTAVLVAAGTVRSNEAAAPTTPEGAVQSLFARVKSHELIHGAGGLLGATRRDWRGQGHFRALTEEQEVWALANGFDEIVVLVLVDELAFPFGQIRIHPKGSDGGHNGLKDIQATLGTQNYARLRFGIAAQFSKGKQVDYVLGKWNEEERKTLPERIKTASEAVKMFAFAGLQQTMNAFNSK